LKKYIFRYSFVRKIHDSRSSRKEARLRKAIFFSSETEIAFK
jgi:hypothetical protein